MERRPHRGQADSTPGRPVHAQVGTHEDVKHKEIKYEDVKYGGPFEALGRQTHDA